MTGFGRQKGLASRGFFTPESDCKIQEDKLLECETCANYFYDEELEEYMCDVNMDEDDLMRFLSNKRESCPYYRNGDEYRIVRRQM